MLQNTWATQLDPLLRNPLVNGDLLKPYVLKSGANQVPHLLARKYQGWLNAGFVPAAAVSTYINLYEGVSQDVTKFINIVSNTAGTITLYVF